MNKSLLIAALAALHGKPSPYTFQRPSIGRSCLDDLPKAKPQPQTLAEYHTTTTKAQRKRAARRKNR